MLSFVTLCAACCKVNRARHRKVFIACAAPAWPSANPHATSGRAVSFTRPIWKDICCNPGYTPLPACLASVNVQVMTPGTLEACRLLAAVPRSFRGAMINHSLLATHHSSAPFYVTGGTLSRDALSYVTRQADGDLYSGLTQGQFCHVLTSRQMGKSSLMVRTAARLREAGAGVVLLDLTAIGQNLTAEQWYGGLLTQIGQQLELDDELEEFWDSHPKLGPLQRWMQAIRHVLLPRYPGPVVIFVDEIDAVRSLPFSTDEFFAAIREFYNRRTEDEELRRLTFCLLGVASPSDLIRDTRTTPFNIGRRIELHDFTAAEAAPLARGLRRGEREGAAILKRALYWTGGHPYMTQRLCQAVANDATVSGAEGADRLCEKLFFKRRAREQDDNLLFVRERILHTKVDLVGLLNLYEQIHRGKRVGDDETNPLVSELRLSGITRVDAERLRVVRHSLLGDVCWVNSGFR